MPGKRKAFCKRGHPRTPDNLWGRVCKLCYYSKIQLARVGRVTPGGRLLVLCGCGAVLKGLYTETPAFFNPPKGEHALVVPRAVYQEHRLHTIATTQIMET